VDLSQSLFRFAEQLLSNPVRKRECLEQFNLGLKFVGPEHSAMARVFEALHPFADAPIEFG
jgi:hypothetical protein